MSTAPSFVPTSPSAGTSYYTYNINDFIIHINIDSFAAPTFGPTCFPTAGIKYINDFIIHINTDSFAAPTFGPTCFPTVKPSFLPTSQVLDSYHITIIIIIIII